MSPDVRALIRDMSTANPLWGAPRIHGELQKLGISVSQSTVAKYMRRHPRPSSQTWRAFLTNHVSQTLAADLRRADGHVPTALRSCHSRARPSTNRSRGGHRPSHRGLDGTTASQCLFGARSAAISTSRSRFGLCRRGDYPRWHERSDSSNGTAVAMAECSRRARHRLDPTRVPRSHHRGQRRGPASSTHCVYHLHMQSRTHLALKKDAPISRPVMPSSGGRIALTPQVGGLHHRYDRIAA